MIMLLTTPSCASCRKAKRWLEENNIPYKERNIFVDRLSKEEIKRMLQMTENGTEEIISTRSKVFQELCMKEDSLSLSKLYKIIEKYPSILRRPIIMDNNRLQVGYNEEEIRCFIPRSQRIFEFKKGVLRDNEKDESNTKS